MPAPRAKAARPRPTSADQVAFDRQLSLRHWSGQDRQSAAAAMGISVSRCAKRERVLELPQVSRNNRDFDPDVAEKNIRVSGYRMVPCRIHRLHGVEFHFWAHRGELRFISRHAVATLLRHMDVAERDPVTPAPVPEA